MVKMVSMRKAQISGNYTIKINKYRFLEIAMIPILQSTDIKCDKDSKYNDSDRDSILVLEVHESLDLTG